MPTTYSPCKQPSQDHCICLPEGSVTQFCAMCSVTAAAGCRPFKMGRTACLSTNQMARSSEKDGMECVGFVLRRLSTSHVSMHGGFPMVRSLA